MATSAEVPGRFNAAVNGRPFMLDLSKLGGLPLRQPRATRRDQVDSSGEFGEQSLEGALVRRTIDDWRLGAGQTFLDKSDRDRRARFRESAGVDPWTQGEIRLLKSAVQGQAITTATNGDVPVAAAGSRIYMAGGETENWQYSDDGGTTWTASLISTAKFRALATDGFNTYLIYHHGIHKHERTSTGAPTVWRNSAVGSEVRVGAFVLGRLMVGAGRHIYDVSAPQTGSDWAADLLFSHRNTDFMWTCFGAGVNAIYAGGYSGDKSMIYRIQVRDDGTTLGAPVPAGALPDGEIIRAIQGYLGVILLGTDRGFRLAVERGGALEYGPLVEIDYGVSSFEPQGQYVWFGWPTHGLGRIDLSAFPDPDELVPAYAKDLTAPMPISLRPTSIVTYDDRRFFGAPAGSTTGHLWRESATDHIASGTLNSGRITFDIPDDKTILALIVEAAGALPAGTSITVDLYVNGALVAGTPTLTAGQRKVVYEWDPAPTGAYASLIVTLETTTPANTPRLSLLTVGADPIPAFQSEIWNLPLMLRDAVLDVQGNSVSVDCDAEYDLLQALEAAGSYTDVQVFGESFKAKVRSVTLTDQNGLEVNADSTFVQGMALTTVERLL